MSVEKSEKKELGVESTGNRFRDETRQVENLFLYKALSVSAPDGSQTHTKQ